FCEKNKESINRRWQLWFIGLTVLMGIARIMIGAHWPSDILGGAIIGIGSAFLVKQLLPAPPDRVMDNEK
ncbi:MAG: phosphatase PAP2 family protein, partial [Candidatus Harrisonbacteria bacterium]|nr:phosphatase PAP2 family protein [Candidatus Harrisonbacteria bacterium]